MVNDGLEHRESGHGPPEGRGPVSLQQHQQVWLWQRVLKTVQSEGLGLGIRRGREGDTKIHTKVQTHTCLCVRVCLCVCAHLLPQEPIPASWPITEPPIILSSSHVSLQLAILLPKGAGAKIGTTAEQAPGL